MGPKDGFASRPMGTKTIALDREAYELLKNRRRPGETFSDVVKRIARNRRPLSAYAGIWKTMSQSDLRKIERAVARGRQLDRERAADLYGTSTHRRSKLESDPPKNRGKTIESPVA